ncbi:MAG TPA: hypothetical protein VMB21_22270 [Candidatus Limnocylindria bacterium]|nr:hypothetical protein [Candidatus Limnocylindria bacterium]
MNASFARRAALLLALTFTVAPLLAEKKPKLQPAEAPAAPEPPPAEPDSPDNAPDVESGIRAGLEQARAEVVRAAHDAHAKFSTMQLAFSGSAATRTLVIPAADVSGKQLGQVREELAIMSRLLNKAADPEGGARAGFRFNLGDLGFGQSTDLDALYLDGYGAVFLIDVDYPLVEPAKVTEAKPDAKPDKDAVWEKARRELAGLDRDGDLDAGEDDFSEPAGQPYDSEKVTALRKRLTEAFRHAANLKSVKPGEDVVVQVSGRSAPGSHMATAAVFMGNPALVKRYGLAVPPPTPPTSGPAISTLTLRAKKSDIDALAAGKLSTEEFAKKLSVSQRDDSLPAK